MNGETFIPAAVRDRDRFIAAIRSIDEENARDPRAIELPYSLRLTEWVRRMVPDASEALAIAARGQHIARWSIPREDFPRGLKGYMQWREGLKAFHARRLAEILRACGYDGAMIERVRVLVTKELLPGDPESQSLEDALCLVFLETQLSEFAARKPREKTVDILRKTWAKMSPRARGLALELPFDHATALLVREAVSE